MHTRAIALLVALTLLVAGCGSDAGSDAGTSTTKAAAEGPDLTEVEFTDLTGQAEVEVTVRDNTFVKQYIEVSPGTTVTFSNRGRTEHNVLPAIDGSFEPIQIAQLKPGMEATITFDEPGDYPYYCSLHGTKTKGMIGGIRVVEA